MDASPLKPKDDYQTEQVPKQEHLLFEYLKIKIHQNKSKLQICLH